MKQISRSNQEMAKPKRPLSAYNFFFQEVRTRIQRTYLAEMGQKAPYSVVSKLVASSWKKVSADEKLRFKRLSMRDKCRYGLEMVEWQRKQQEERSLKDSIRERVLPSSDVTHTVKSTSDTFEDYPLVNVAFSSKHKVPTTGPLLRFTNDQEVLEPLALTEDSIFDDWDIHYLAERFSPAKKF